MNGFDKVKEKMDSSLLQKLAFNEFFHVMNEISDFSQGPKGGCAQCLRDAESTGSNS